MDVEGFYVAASQASTRSFTNAQNTIVRDVSLAGLTIRLNFAGDVLLPVVLPAISHLLIDSISKEADYVIEIWDSASTYSDFPIAPCSVDNIEFRGEINGLKSNRFESAYFTHARMLTLLDHENKKGIVCLVDSSDVPAFELACPLRGILSWILRRNNVVMLHAAAVGTADGNILIGGNSGAGKSSTALRCLVGGLNYLGDDICAISLNDEIPQVHSIYSSGKTLSCDLSKFPELLPALHAHYDEYYQKELFFFNTLFPNRLKPSGQLSAVVIPYQNALLPIGFQELSYAKALSVIATSTKSLLPDAGNETFHMLSLVLHRVPCYQFNLGSDPKKIAPTLADFIMQLKHNHGKHGT
jgi:hypothetical protein